MGTDRQPRGADVAMGVRIGALVVFVATLSTAANVWAGVIAWTISSLTFQHGVMSLIDVLLRAALQLPAQGQGSQEGIIYMILALVNAGAAWTAVQKQGLAFWLARRVRRAAT